MITLQQQARALGDPTRHAIFRHVADAGRPVDVAELTELLALNHNAIRQHLAKLLEAELVVERRLLSGGRGRPRLVYEIAPGVGSQWGVVGPFERLSRLLAEVVSTGDSPIDVGRRAGVALATPANSAEATLSDIADVMTRQGFDPEVRVTKNSAEVVLRNCPFEAVAVQHPDTVCSLHLGIAEGLADAGVGVTVAELIAKDPRRASCRLKLGVESSA
ncbi:MAG: helix-turn-helix transcriptional regulator [Acidimicrobiia bacterium]